MGRAIALGVAVWLLVAWIRPVWIYVPSALMGVEGIWAGSALWSVLPSLLLFLIVLIPGGREG